MSPRSHHPSPPAPCSCFSVLIIHLLRRRLILHTASHLLSFIFFSAGGAGHPYQCSYLPSRPPPVRGFPGLLAQPCRWPTPAPLEASSLLLHAAKPLFLRLRLRLLPRSRLSSRHDVPGSPLPAAGLRFRLPGGKIPMLGRPRSRESRRSRVLLPPRMG